VRYGWARDRSTERLHGRRRNGDRARRGSAVTVDGAAALCKVHVAQFIRHSAEDSLPTNLDRAPLHPRERASVIDVS
jgi:hypothetical protein